MGTSCYIMAYIALDRLWLITKPLSYPVYATRGNILLTVLVTWIFTAVISTILTLTQTTPVSFNRFPYCYTHSVKTKFAFAAGCFLLVIVPLLVVAITYIIIFIKVSKLFRSEIYENSKRNRELCRESKYQDETEKKVPCMDTTGLIRAGKTVIYPIIFSFFTFPYFITTSIVAFAKPEREFVTFFSKTIDDLALLAFTTFLINPLIYAWWHKGFRHAIMEVWKSHQKKQQQKRTLKNELAAKTTKQVQATNPDIWCTVVGRNESTLMTTKDLKKIHFKERHICETLPTESTDFPTERMRKR